MDTTTGDAVLRNPRTGKPVLAPDGKPFDTSPGRMGEILDMMGEWGDKDVGSMTPKERRTLSEFGRNVRAMLGSGWDGGSTSKPPPPDVGWPPIESGGKSGGKFDVSPEIENPRNQPPNDSDDFLDQMRRYMLDARDRAREFFEDLPFDMPKPPPPGGPMPIPRRRFPIPIPRRR